MKCHLEYGKFGLDVELPERNLLTIAKPRSFPGLTDESFAIDHSIKNPIQSDRLCDMPTSPQTKVVIAVSDITRPTPVSHILPHLLIELKQGNVQEQNITIIIANGLHRNATDTELQWLIGSPILERIKVVNHNAQNQSQLIDIGYTSYGTQLQVNNYVHTADLLICIDYCEPHFFAGFSGGRKTILPGISGKDSILNIHRPALIDHPNVVNGVIDDNPLHLELIEAARMVGVDFIVNTVLNDHKHIINVASGDLEAAHNELIDVARQSRTIEIPEQADIILTTNGGWPLDQNFYQSVKGLGIVTRIKKPIIQDHGVIILVTRCDEGFGRHKTWIDRLKESKTPSAFIEQLYATNYKQFVDDWQAQVLARILERYDVIVVSEGLTENDINSCYMSSAKSVEKALELAYERVGRDSRLVVLPSGPAVLPTLR